MDEKFLSKIKKDYPFIKIITGVRFAFRPPKTIVIQNSISGTGGQNSDSLLFLHEMGHALCGHRSFKTEVGRLRMEVMAWEKAKELAVKYEVKINEELIETELDTYRDWLHQKSRCPECGLTRFQTSDGMFHCPLCEMD